MKIQAHTPTSTERKKGRATCKCGLSAVLIYGEKPNSLPLCDAHNKEYVDGINRLIEQSRTRKLEDSEYEELVKAGAIEPVHASHWYGARSTAMLSMIGMLAAVGGYSMPRGRR